METLAIVAAVGGTALQTIGQIQAGNAAAKAANFEAKQMQIQAGQERATAQRTAAEEKRKARIVQSNLVARAAASGGGAFDPSVIDLSGDLAEEGLYRSNSALYAGEERARSLETGASLKRFEGQQARKASYFKAASTALTSGSSLYDRYASNGYG